MNHVTKTTTSLLFLFAVSILPSYTEDNSFQIMAGLIEAARANSIEKFENNIYFEANFIQTNNKVPKVIPEEASTPLLGINASIEIRMDGLDNFHATISKTRISAQSYSAEDIARSETHFTEISSETLVQNSSIQAKRKEHFLVSSMDSEGYVTSTQSPWEPGWVLTSTNDQSPSLAYTGYSPVFWLYSHFIGDRGSFDLSDVLDKIPAEFHSVEIQDDDQLEWIAFYPQSSDVPFLLFKTSIEEPEKFTELTRFRHDGSILESILVSYNDNQPVSIFFLTAKQPGIFSTAELPESIEYTTIEIDITAYTEQNHFPAGTFEPETYFQVGDTLNYPETEEIIVYSP